MGPDQRPPGTALTDRLLSRPQGYDLFQAIGLLERAAPAAERLGTGNGRREAVRLSAVVSLAFAASDVADVRRLDPTDGGSDRADWAGVSARRWQLDTPVLALAGAGGLLPLPYTEMLLAQRSARDRAPLDFLDIFQHRWLSLLYRGRKKHHVSLQWDATPDVSHSPLARTLAALSGLDLGARGPAGERVWLRHAALQGAAPRSMAQLESLAADRLGLPVRGRQFIGGWLALDARETTRLGRAPLGRTALGRRVWDSGAGIALDIGPVPPARWAALLPGGADLAQLRWLVAQQVSQDLQLHVTLQPQAADAPPRPAGGLRLGWNTWLAGGAHRATGHPPAPLRLQLGSTATPEAAVTRRT